MHLLSWWAICVWTISLLSIALMLLRPGGIAEAYWACGGALLLVAARLLPPQQALHAIREGLDVYLFLTGMMILAELAREEGVFDWLADIAAQHANSSSKRLFVLIYIAGTVVTVFLSNDATAVVLTPAVLAIVRRAGVSPRPYLFACAFIANAASFVLPISNPANLVVFDQSVPPLASWLRVFLLPSLASVLLTLLCLRFLCRKELDEQITGGIERIALSSNGKLALTALLLSAAALITASALGWPLGAPTCIAALSAMIVVALRDRTLPRRVVTGVSWSVLPLVAGLFVIMEALQGAGMLELGLDGLSRLARLPSSVAKMAAAGVVALLSNLMNNLPVGLIGGAAIRSANEPSIAAHAILIGVDLGPNLSVTGSLATILWLIALRRERVEITPWEFLKVGMVTMPISLAGALLFLWK